MPVYRRLLSDALTPVSAFHKIDPAAVACLFESVIGGEKVGRYSFLAAEPFLQIAARGNAVTVDVGRRQRRASTSRRPAGGAAPRRRSRSRPYICRSCRRSPAAPSATPATTWSATSRTCRTPRPTTAACPTWRSPSTTGWSCSTT